MLSKIKRANVQPTRRDSGETSAFAPDHNSTMQMMAEHCFSPILNVDGNVRVLQLLVYWKLALCLVCNGWNALNRSPKPSCQKGTQGLRGAKCFLWNDSNWEWWCGGISHTSRNSIRRFVQFLKLLPLFWVLNCSLSWSYFYHFRSCHLWMAQERGAHTHQWTGQAYWWVQSSEEEGYHPKNCVRDHFKGHEGERLALSSKHSAL